MRPVGVEVKGRTVVEVVAGDADLVAGLFECHADLGQGRLDLSGLNQFHVTTARAVAVFALVACQ